MRTLRFAALDVVLVIVFAIVGRLSHDESISLSGVAATAWPFLVGLVVGWAIVLLARRRFPESVLDGVPVWIATVAVGMLLRAVTDGGTAFAFVIVATIMLAILLLGWRAIASRSTRARRARKQHSPMNEPRDVAPRD